MRGAAAGERHPLLVALPVPVAGIAGERRALELGEGRPVALAQQARALAHHGHRRPALRVDDVGAGEGLLHRAGDRERAAAAGREGAGGLERLVDQVVALGVGEDDVHAEPGHQRDHPLRHRERLAVGGGVRPGHRQALAAQRLEAAVDADEVREVGEALRRVVEVALQVDHRRPLREHAFAVALGERGRDLRHVGVPFAEVHVVADADDLGEEADHGGGLAHGLAVGDLRGRLLELLGAEAEQVAGRLEGVAGARRLVAEDREPQAGVEEARREVGAVDLLERLRGGEHEAERRLALAPGEQEVAVVEPGRERAQGVDLPEDAGRAHDLRASWRVAAKRCGKRA